MKRDGINLTLILQIQTPRRGCEHGRHGLASPERSFERRKRMARSHLRVRPAHG